MVRLNGDVSSPRLSGDTYMQKKIELRFGLVLVISFSTHYRASFHWQKQSTWLCERRKHGMVAVLRLGCDVTLPSPTSTRCKKNF